MGGTEKTQRADGWVVKLLKHPEASVHFKYGQLRSLLVEFVFDGRPPVRRDYVPTAAGAADLAEFVIAQIAGKGGGAATATDPADP